jgi:hypothetical protein
MPLIIAIVYALLVATAAEADVGLGVSAKTDNATVYIPIKVGRFMFEPYVRATDREAASVSRSGTFFVTNTTTASDVEAYAVGVGIFRAVPLAERITMYYGGRLARIDEDLKSFTATGTTAPPTLPLEPSQVATAEGTSIIPTIGFHYNVLDRLSIGAEIAWEHSEVDTVNRSQTGSMPTSTSEITVNSTRADIILRFFF